MKEFYDKVNFRTDIYQGKYRDPRIQTERPFLIVSHRYLLGLLDNKGLY